MAITAPPNTPCMAADLGISEGVIDAEQKRRPKLIPKVEIWYRSKKKKICLVLTYPPKLTE